MIYFWHEDDGWRYASAVGLTSFGSDPRVTSLGQPIGPFPTYAECLAAYRRGR